MGTNSGEVMPRVTGHCEGVSLTECWGDTTTGHLMCECPESCPLASHNRSLRTLGVGAGVRGFPGSRRRSRGGEERRRVDARHYTEPKQSHCAVILQINSRWWLECFAYLFSYLFRLMSLLYQDYAWLCFHLLVQMSDNNLSRICLYKCMGRHKSCMNNSWIIQNPKYHKYRIPFFAVLASSLSSPGIGYLGHKMRVCLTIGLVYARIWHPSMTENPPQHTPASQFFNYSPEKSATQWSFTSGNHL